MRVSLANAAAARAVDAAVHQQHIGQVRCDVQSAAAAAAAESHTRAVGVCVQLTREHETAMAVARRDADAAVAAADERARVARAVLCENADRSERALRDELSRLRAGHTVAHASDRRAARLAASLAASQSDAAASAAQLAIQTAENQALEAVIASQETRLRATAVLAQSPFGTVRAELAQMQRERVSLEHQVRVGSWPADIRNITSRHVAMCVLQVQFWRARASTAQAALRVSHAEARRGSRRGVPVTRRADHLTCRALCAML